MPGNIKSSMDIHPQRCYCCGASLEVGAEGAKAHKQHPIAVCGPCFKDKCKEKGFYVDAVVVSEESSG